MISKFGILILTMFGIGRSRFAPGTLASLVTCLVYFPIFIFKPNFLILIITFALFSIYSIVLIDLLQNKFKKKDPREIVIDEFIGQSIPILSVYVAINITGAIEKNWYDYLGFLSTSFLSFFLLFRFFDILKPFPINVIDKKIKNGFGVVFDDILAGIFSTIIYWIGYYFYYLG
jgi:phosphatidylglycerophosphatase A